MCDCTRPPRQRTPATVINWNSNGMCYFRLVNAAKGSFPSEKFMKNVVRISLAERLETQSALSYQTNDVQW